MIDVVPRSAVGTRETQESREKPLSQPKPSGRQSSLLLCLSVLFRSWTDWGGPSALLSLLIQMLTASRDPLKDTSLGIPWPSQVDT